MSSVKGYISDSTRIFKIIGFVPVNNKILDFIRFIYMILATILLSITIWLLSLLQMIIGDIFEDSDKFFMYSLTMGSISQCCLKMFNNCVNYNYIDQMNKKIIEIDKLFKTNHLAQELVITPD